MQTNSNNLHVAMRRPAPLAVATMPAFKADSILLAGLLAAVTTLILAKLATI